MKISKMSFIIDTNCTNERYEQLKEIIIKNSTVHMNREHIGNIISIEYKSGDVLVTVEMIKDKELSWTELEGHQICISSRSNQIELEK